MLFSIGDYLAGMIVGAVTAFAVRMVVWPGMDMVLDLMTPLSRRVGPELNRDTVGNVQKAGFRIRREENVYLDIVKIIEGVKQAG